MPEESVLIEGCDQPLDLIKRVGTQLTLLGLPVTARVLWSDRLETLERVESVDASTEIVGLQNSAEVRPRHKAPATKHTALDDRPLYGEDTLEDFVSREESRQVLPPRILRKFAELNMRRIWILIECPGVLEACLLLRRGALCTLTANRLIHSRSLKQELHDTITLLLTPIRRPACGQLVWHATVSGHIANSAERDNLIRVGRMSQNDL